MPSWHGSWLSAHLGGAATLTFYTTNNLTFTNFNMSLVTPGAPLEPQVATSPTTLEPEVLPRPAGPCYPGALGAHPDHLGEPGAFNPCHSDAPGGPQPRIKSRTKVKIKLLKMLKKVSR